MKQLLCAVAAIALMIPAASSAQAHKDRNDKSQTQRSQARQAHQKSQNQKRTSRPARTVQRTVNRTRTPTRVTKTTRVTRPARTVQRTTRVTTRQNAGSRTIYRIGHRPTSYHRIRAQSFRYPRGYSYRRWGIGSILPRLFLSSLYYYGNYGALGLGPPPPGYVWVRYGPDLLLVNRYTGRIADVIYGAFY